jgi:threonine dehydratase
MRLDELERATTLVHSAVSPTAQICWPLLSERYDCQVWVKHENHTPIGSFKIRGAIVYVDVLQRSVPRPGGVVACSKGNFGQGIAYAARRAGMAAVVVVPNENSHDKNAAMRGLGADVLHFGDDFEESYAHAVGVAEERGYHMAPSYHPLLTLGIASYGLELFRAVRDLDTVYVPIGQGSGISGVIAARDALGLSTEVVGVVSERLPAYALSYERGVPVTTPPATSVADGMSIRVPVPEALDLIRARAARVLTVSEDAIMASMRHYFSDTHNVAEGAGAVALAGLGQERALMRGKRVGVILTGGNVDSPVFAKVLTTASG